MLHLVILKFANESEEFLFLTSVFGKLGQFPDILLNFGGQEGPKLVYMYTLFMLACVVRHL